MIEPTEPQPELASQGDAAPVAPQQAVAAPLPPPEPTLAVYFGEPAPKLAEWVKAVRAAGRFAASDAEGSLGQISEHDSDLRKTVALAGVGNPPPALKRWLADATRQLLTERLKDVSVDPHAPAHEQLGRIAIGLAPGLTAKGRTARAAAENLLRLAIKLVTDAKPDFSAGEMLTALFAPLREPKADTRVAPAALRRRVQEAGIAQLRDLSLAHAAALDRILGAERARAEVQERAGALDSALTVERDRVRELRERLAIAEARAASQEAEAVKLAQAITDNRQIGAHGTAEMLARLRTLLAGRLDPLLADAADALEIEPPVIKVAKHRIDASRSAIKGEITWLDESSG